jgi:hypothetical protein
MVEIIGAIIVIGSLAAINLGPFVMWRWSVVEKNKLM